MEVGTIFSEMEYEKHYEFVISKGFAIKEVNSKQEYVEREVEIINEKGECETKVEMKLQNVRYFQIVEASKPAEAELAKIRIEELKNKLSSTDYVAIKIAESEATAEEYSEILAQRKAWRAEINQLEALGA